MPGHFESWHSNSDFTQFTFKLAKDVRFSNGQPATLEDVAQTLVHLTHKESTVRHIFEDVVGIESLLKDEQLPSGIFLSKEGIVFKLKRPISKFPNLLADSRIGLFPARAYRESKDFFDRPIGAGAYRIKDWNQSSGFISLLRNEFFAAPQAAIPEFEISLEEDIEKAIAKFENYEADDLEGYNVNPSQLKRKDIRLFSTSFQTESLFFNPRRFLSSEQRFALLRVLEIENWRTKCFSSLDLAESNIPNTVIGGNKNKASEVKKAFPERTRAVRLLREMGPLVFSQLVDGASPCTARHVREVARVNGLKIVYEVVDNSMAKQRLESGNYDVFTEFLTIRDSEPISMLSLAYGKSGINLTGDADPEFDKLYELAIASQDRLERIEIYKRMDSILVSKARAFPLFAQNLQAVFGEKVGARTVPNILFGLTNFHEIWMEP